MVAKRNITSIPRRRDRRDMNCMICNREVKPKSPRNPMDVEVWRCDYCSIVCDTRKGGGLRYWLGIGGVEPRRKNRGIIDVPEGCLLMLADGEQNEMSIL